MYGGQMHVAVAISQTWPPLHVGLHREAAPALPAEPPAPLMLMVSPPLPPVPALEPPDPLLPPVCELPPLGVIGVVPSEPSLHARARPPARPAATNSLFTEISPELAEGPGPGPRLLRECVSEGRRNCG